MAIAPGHHVVKRSVIDNPICASVLMPPVTFNPIPPSTSVDPVTRNPVRIMVRIVNVVARNPNIAVSIHLSAPDPKHDSGSEVVARSQPLRQEEQP